MNGSSLSREERLCAMFDSYCKKVISNESKNYKRLHYRRKKYELIKEVEFINSLEGVSSERNDTLKINLGKFSCEIQDETLYKAMLLLPTKHLLIIVLSYWYDWKKKEISSYLGLDAKTVYNYRKKSFELIKKCFTEESNKNETKL